MAQPPANSPTVRLLAFACSVCPFCVVARRFPNSAYARMLHAIETRCPACRAYDKVHDKPPTGRD